MRNLETSGLLPVGRYHYASWPILSMCSSSSGSSRTQSTDDNVEGFASLWKASIMCRTSPIDTLIRPLFRLDITVLCRPARLSCWNELADTGSSEAELGLINSALHSVLS